MSCIIFGIALIANTQVAGDGMWYWYATFWHDGAKLYSGMHLALQPLFVLETGWFMALLGKGWLVSKVPALLHLFAYCLGLLLLANASRLSNKAKAAVLASAFFISIAFDAYRFDDYHVLADSFQVYSLVLLLRLSTQLRPARNLFIAPALGILSGLAIMTRLNDGAALFLGVAISLLCLAPSKKIVTAALFVLAAALTVLLTVRLTGDSLHDYATYSIFKAAGSKGGTANVLAYPFRLPWNTLRWLSIRWHQKWPIFALASALGWGFLLSSRHWKVDRRQLWKPVLGGLIVSLPLISVLHAFFESRIIEWMAAVGTLVTFAFGLLVSLKLCRWVVRPQTTQWDPREVLILIPLGQLASASMSSGGRHVGLYGPLAIMLLLMPVCCPVRVTSRHLQAAWMALMLILLSNCVLYKIKFPYSWHSYRAKPLFVGRQWFHHPEYGPMVIETQQLELFQNVCTAIAAGSGPRTVLSLPFPYANYFCAMPPWHNYVQTFFDTSSSETILGVTNELLTGPPQWVVYQRQLDNMSMHEETYTRGQPLPHRYLDQVIEDKLATRQWQTVLSSSFGERENWSNQWILIRTQPPPAP